MTHIHPYNVGCFTALKILGALPFRLTLSPLTTTYIFTVSAVLLFPEYHIVAITQYVAFLD